jgi:uncharacterized heparinase superfamily protein
MSPSGLTLRALRARITGPSRAWRNRLQARRSRLGTRPARAETLPEPVLIGDADRGQALIAGHWPVRGQDVIIAPGSIWTAGLPEERLEDERQACLWLDDLAAVGNRAARGLAQSWIQDWIRRFGTGSGPGWTPEVAGRRAQHWTAHCQLLTEGLDRTAADRFWRALAAQQRYLVRMWSDAPKGLPRLHALSGLVWTGLALPHAGHRAAAAELGAAAEALVDAEGATPSRSPEDLAETLMLLIWTARALENAEQTAAPNHLASIVRGVQILRLLRLGDGTLPRFQGGGPGEAARIDQALAELRSGVQDKPKLPMGYARLIGGRAVVLMDGAGPPTGEWATGAHAGTLAFEMGVGRVPLVVNCGPGQVFGEAAAIASRQTAAHSTLELDGRSSARIETRGLAARTFGARLEAGPQLVAVRQAQDASGQWLLATHDGYVPTYGLLHERRLFIDARGTELRGEDLLSAPEARARQQFDRRARGRRVPFVLRFHLHPAIGAEHDRESDVILLGLPTGETWMFRAAGGALAIEDSVYYDPARPEPRRTVQVVVRGEVVEYLGQVIWSLARLSGPPAAPEA